MKPNVSNGAIYRKVMTFSIRRFFICLLFLVMLGLLAGGGFLFSDKMFDWKGSGLVGMGVGTVIAIVLIAILSHFFMYIIKAGMIAVIMKSVTEDKIPDNCWETGKAMVKERFVTVAVYYAATGLIKGLFQELGHLISKVGEAVGGDSGGAVGGAISIVINTIVEYLCDCCLGYVFYRKDKGAFKATCEGAVIFFKHGKTFLKNMGRIFGMGLASLIAIGGAFFGIIYAILTQFSGPISKLSAEIGELQSTEDSKKWIDILSNPTYLTIAFAVIGAIILWSIVHGTFIKPFVMVGVMRNYMSTAVENIPEESEFGILEKNCKKFDKLKGKYENELS